MGSLLVMGFSGCADMPVFSFLAARVVLSRSSSRSVRRQPLSNSCASACPEKSVADVAEVSALLECGGVMIVLAL